MCPPLSCCYGRSSGYLPTLLYYLSRLLLANQEALTPSQRRRSSARLDVLWHRYHADLHERFAGHWLYAPALADQLVAALLERACCQETLCRCVLLAEALRGSRHAQRRQRRLRPHAAPW